MNGPAQKREIVLGGPLDGSTFPAPLKGMRNTIIYRVLNPNSLHRYRWSGAVWEYQGLVTRR